MRAVLSSVKVQIVFEKYVGLNPPPPVKEPPGPCPCWLEEQSGRGTLCSLGSRAQPHPRPSCAWGCRETFLGHRLCPREA